MFENLTKKFVSITKHLKGQARITESNTKEIISELRFALLEADVALPVVKEFLSRVKEKALGEAVLASLSPGQAFVDLVNTELIRTLGGESSPFLTLKNAQPQIILVVGLQGTGKTTTCGKLALWLKENRKSKVLLTSCDIHRAAAITQLSVLSQQASVDFYEPNIDLNLNEMVTQATKFAKKHLYETLIIDSAGRLSIDEAMMKEIQLIYEAVQPKETLYVLDAMQGQEAVNVAKIFNEKIDLTGVILTKTDGDSRGGSILSVKTITGCPIRFIGQSEQLDGLEEFNSHKFAKRLLGMGDMLSLIQKAKNSLQVKENEKIIRKVSEGKGFNLDDFKSQLQQMKKMGGLSSLMSFLPQSLQSKAENVDVSKIESSTRRQEAIISSMTKQEKTNPEILKASRKKRIAKGSGTTIQEVNQMLNQFNQIQKTMKKVGGNTIANFFGKQANASSALSISQNTVLRKKKMLARKKRKSKRR